MPSGRVLRVLAQLMFDYGILWIVHPTYLAIIK
jgi:hypothetical protein